MKADCGIAGSILLIKVMIVAIFAVVFFIQAIVYGFLTYFSFTSGVVKYGKTFGLVMLSLLIYSLGSCLEPLYPDLAWMTTWNYFIYAGFVWSAPLWLYLALQYGRHIVPGRSKASLMLFFVPALTLLVRWTDPLHHLCYADTWVMPGEGLRMIGFTPGPWYGVYMVYSFLCLTAGTIVFLHTCIVCASGSKRQALTVSLGAILPLLGMAIYIFARDIIVVDIIPITLLPSSFFFLHGLFRFRFLTDPPLTITSAVHSMGAAYLILGRNCELMEANQAAQRLFPGLSSVKSPCSLTELTLIVPLLSEIEFTAVSASAEHTVVTGDITRRVNSHLDEVRDTFGELCGYNLLLIMTGEKCLTVPELHTRYVSELKMLEKIMHNDKPYLSPDLTLPMLAEMTGISRTVLSMLINRIYGKQFNDYINGYRVDEARQVLTGERMQMQELVYYSGFNSRTAFYTAFRKYTGKSPREFLSELQESASVSP